MHFNKYNCSVLILFLFLTIQLIAQPTFNKTIDFSNGDDVGFGIVKLDDGYVLIGNGWGYEIGAYFDEKVKYAKIDFEGNVLWQKVLGSVDSQYFSYFMAGELLSDGNIVFAGSKAADGMSNVMLIKFNPETGDTLFTKTYFSEQWQMGMQVFEFSNGDLLLLCVGGTTVFYRTILKKTDAEGNLIWSKLIGESGESGSALMGPIDEDDNFFLLHAFIGCPTPLYETRLFDSAGIILNEELHEGGCFTYGIKSVIGGYYGGGVNKPDYPYNTFAFRLDDSGVLQWIFTSTYNLDTIYDSELAIGPGLEYPNGDLLVIGYLATEPYGTYHGYMARVDINGNAIWERRYLAPGGPDNDNRIHDVELTDAGGIIIAGAAYGEVYAEDQNFWVMQLDSVGCLVPGCDSLDVSILPMPFNNEFTVFPNPAKSYCVVQTGMPAQTETSIQLFSVDGTLIKTFVMHAGNISATLPLEKIPAGMYFVKIENEKGMHATLKLAVN